MSLVIWVIGWGVTEAMCYDNPTWKQQIGMAFLWPLYLGKYIKLHTEKTK